MDRLTSCDMYFDDVDKRLFYHKLKQYEDAEEQGLLFRLPCKEVYTSSGDTVYYIFDHEIVECINCGVSMDCEGKLWIALACDEHIFPYRNPDPEHDLDPTDWCINTTQVTINEWGKTIFLTEEEAEQCPLRELMEKQKHSCIDNEFQRGAKTGYNACIDELLEEE